MIRQWKTHRGGFAGHRSFSATLDSAVYGGQASPTLEFDSAIVAGDTESSVTAHDYIETNFGIANGALFLFNLCATRGTRGDHAMMSIGSTDKTNQSCVSINMQDNTANVQCSRYGDTSHVMIRHQPDHTAGLISTAEYNGAVTDGLQVNWDDAETGGWETTALLLRAENIASGTIALTTQDTEITETIGFEADVIILYSNNQGLGSSGAFHNISVGFVVWDGATITQSGACHSNIDAQANSVPSGYVSSTRCGAQVAASSLDYSVEATAVNSTQFKLTARDGAANDTFCYLALSLGAKKAWTGVIDTPTSTGTGTSFTSTGVAPEFGMHVMSLVQATATVASDNTAGGFGVSAFNATTEASHSFSDEDAAATTNTANMVKAVMAYLDNDDFSDTFETTLSSFDAEGWTPNVSNVIGAGTAMKWPTLMIGAEAAAGGGIPGSLALMGVGI